ncbi:MAG TPA: hypothetical protein VF177_11460 [Anaerolineae bacterium]
MAERGENVRTRDGALEVISAEWWQRLGEVLVQSARDLFRDDGPQWAAAIAYYALLSSFPLALAIVAIATLHCL